MVLELFQTIYSTVQAAIAFFQELLRVFKFLNYKRSKANPCLHYKWSDLGKLIVWLSWVDDCVVGGCGQDLQNKRKNEETIEMQWLQRGD